MDTTTNDHSTATIMHLSTFTQYLIPLGNFIFPIILWCSYKDRSEYLNQQGKQVINFQLSLLLYSLVLLLIALPVLILFILKGFELSHLSGNNFEYVMERFSTENLSCYVIIVLMALFILIAIQVFEFVMVIYAAVKTSNGADFKYPLTISFLK